jgi:DNA-binding transcriptional MerR regulator
MAGKDPGAFKTIGELSEELGVAQHILRYWETKFPQLRPLQRAGNRRYYRPADAELARRIHHLLSGEGYTIRGVQKLLATNSGAGTGQPDAAAAPPPPAPVVQPSAETPAVPASAVDFERLVTLRDRLVAALAE